MVSPFICALIVLICAELNSFPITTVFTEYVDVMNQVLGHNGRGEMDRIIHYKYKTLYAAF